MYKYAHKDILVYADKHTYASMFKSNARHNLNAYFVKLSKTTKSYDFTCKSIDS